MPSKPSANTVRVAQWRAGLDLPAFVGTGELIPCSTQGARLVPIVACYIGFVVATRV
jgi:hypothetical protein